MHTLLIQHEHASSPARFKVARHQPFHVVPETMVVEAPSDKLLKDLRWYMEEFLDYPFPPNTERAEGVLESLKDWGSRAFVSLFNAGQSRDYYHTAISNGLDHLELRIVVDDPRILAWPWESLHDPEHGYLAQQCHIERQLPRVADPLPLPENLPSDRVNILLATARPFPHDVAYRSISRRLVELAASVDFPAEVTVLRPPTLENLERMLEDRPGYYHVVHFDGHGGYMAAGPGHFAGPHKYQGPQGHLVFESASGEPDAISAERLANLLKQHRVPAMVLNACQSAMMDNDADDALASVAASLLRAGVRSVVAMAYSLYVSGAQQFLPAFYQGLFKKGTLAEAVRAGRRSMYRNSERVCARGTFPLADWLVPVVYQQQPLDFSFVAAAAPAEEPDRTPLPSEFSDTANPYGFIGRDGVILDMERAMHRPPPVILIHGLGGVGKTTLARGFVQWLHQTNGLGAACFWISFRHIRTAESALNQIGAPLFGPQFIVLPNDEKVRVLADALNEHRCILVWDNFESVWGNDAAGIDPLMPPEDRQLLREFLQALTGGQSKILMTSRSEETWLPAEFRRRIELGGLDGEERWEFCSVILDNLGLKVDRSDRDLADLMSLLGGHPLLMRAVLPQLERQLARSIAEAIRNNLTKLDSATEATLRFVEDGLPAELRLLLLPLGLHERCVDADYLEAMAEQADAKLSRATIDRFMGALATAGLLWEVGPAVHELHPALTGFLRDRVVKVSEGDATLRWTRAFVDVMGSLADALAPRQLHEQRVPFIIHEANFHSALEHAERQRMDQDFAAVTQSLAAYAQNTQNFDGAERLFLRLAEHHLAQGNREGEAAAYHQLGIIAEERREFDRAEQWYLKSLAISEKQGNERYAASTYHQLGRIAEERREFDRAEQWYLKSLAIKEKQGNEHGAANTYHQLGIIAQERREFDRAEQWYLKSLAIEEKQGNEHGAASTYHQLGRIAEERREFDRAEQWYLKSLAISEKQGNERYAASTYHQLGRIAEERREFDRAEQWYLKSLAIKEKQGNEHGAASTYHQLGVIAQKRGEFDRAEQWYLKSLAIKEKQGNEHGAATTYGQLGIVAGQRGEFEECGHWLIRSVRTFLKCEDEHGAARNARNFALFCGRAPAEEAAALRAMWQEAGLPPLPTP